MRNTDSFVDGPSFETVASLIAGDWRARNVQGGEEWKIEQGIRDFCLLNMVCGLMRWMVEYIYIPSLWTKALGRFGMDVVVLWPLYT